MLESRAEFSRQQKNPHNCGTILKTYNQVPFVIPEAWHGKYPVIVYYLPSQQHLPFKEGEKSESVTD